VAGIVAICSGVLIEIELQSTLRLIMPSDDLIWPGQRPFRGSASAARRLS
jgi:hypothetical protein